MSSSGCGIDPIDVNFHLQKSLEIFEKNSTDKIWSNKDKGIKMSPPPLPNRVNFPTRNFEFSRLLMEKQRVYIIKQVIHENSEFGNFWNHLVIRISWLFSQRFFYKIDIYYRVFLLYYFIPTSNIANTSDV